MNRGKVLCYYVTGHGYGHATRVIGQVKFLLERNYEIHVISSLDPTFFRRNVLDTDHGDQAHRLHCYQRVLDAGAVQLDPLHVDIEQTLTNYFNNIHTNHEKLVEQERKFLVDVHANLVLVDATPLPCSAAKAASIPSVIVSNFTWDVTYQFLLDVVRAKLSADDILKYTRMIEQVSTDVCNAEYYLRLPGITPLPPLYRGKVIPGPLICRKANLSRTHVRESLNISESTFVLILGFGGFKLSGSWALRDESLPPNWVCIVLGSEGDPMPSHRYITVPKDAYVPNLIGAADAVLGKLGYGTVSECLSHGTPLLYVPRTDWPEEEHLSKFIMGYQAGVRTEEADFLAGKWSQYLNAALELKGKWSVDDLNVTRALDEVEKILNDIINETK